MLPEEKQKRIEQIKHMLKEVAIVPIATVSPGSIPHNTPVFMAFDRDFNGIWSSHADAQHSLNLAHTGEVFLSVFDSRGQYASGLFIDANASIVEADDPDFMQAYTIYAKAKQAYGAPIPDVEHFATKNGQRLYCAVPKQLWINYSSKDGQGIVTHDHRFRVTIASLQGK
jgi:hypothetical protein